MEAEDTGTAAAKPQRASLSREGWFWMVGMALTAVTAMVLSRFNTATTLVPLRSDAIGMAIIISLLIAALSIFVGLHETRGSLLDKIWGGVIGFGLSGFFAPFLLLGQLADLYYARIDFPPDKVRTFNALLPIGRTWHSKPRRSPESFIIQPSPLWSNIDIAREDWNFMLAELKLDNGPKRDDIPSNGHFCARVLMQQAGSALRVLNAGSNALPKGSIIVCPPEVAGLPFLEIR